MTVSPVLHLAPGVHGAPVGPDLVLLDTRRDAYFCLPHVGALDPARVACGALEAVPAALGAELCAAGLAQGAAHPRPGLVFAPPRRDLLETAGARVSAGEMAGFALALASLAITYRGRTFAQVLRHAAARRRTLTQADAAGLARRALAFRTLMPWSPVQGACLMQSALCLAFLAQAGLTADWVFGVRTWPFSAHCWVQAGECVLNDSVERVCAYQPLLKV